MDVCHAIRIPIIERLFMPLSSQTSDCCDQRLAILQSPPLPGSWNSSFAALRSLTRRSPPCMNPPNPPRPASLSRWGQGPKRGSATTTKPPVCLVHAFILVVLHGCEGPKHPHCGEFTPSQRPVAAAGLDTLQGTMLLLLDCGPVATGVSSRPR
jgi:hypothetical protein